MICVAYNIDTCSPRAAYATLQQTTRRFQYHYLIAVSYARNPETSCASLTIRECRYRKLHRTPYHYLVGIQYLHDHLVSHSVPST